MQSQSVLSHGIQDFNSMAKSEVSKTLFGQIKWEEISRSGVFLSHIEHQLLERSQLNLAVVLDNVTEAQSLSKILLNIAENCRTNLTVQQYVFTRIEEILGLGTDYGDADAEAYGPKHAKYFTSDGESVVDSPFLKAMQAEDPYLQKSAALGYACLLTVCKGNESALVQWISGRMTSVASGSWEAAVPVLAVMSRKVASRQAFVAEGGVNRLKLILRSIGSNGSAQSIYELVFIVWTLSLGPDADVSKFLHAGIIPLLAELISAAPSRKIVRMCVGALKNLADTHDPDALTEMLTVGVQRLLDGILTGPKAAADPEFDYDVKHLSDTLLTNYRDLSAFDRWVSQIHSGSLRPGIVHQEKFWRENSRFLEADNFKLLKSLIQLVKHEDPETIKLALFDLGEFARFYPNGRGVVRNLGGRDVALELLSSSNAELQAKALQCVSKLMVTNWEFMK